MPLLKLSTSSKPSTPATEQPPVQTPGGSRLKIKLGGSKPSTPLVETGDGPPSAISAKGAKGKKRAAGDELASPAVKRVASDAARRPSLTLKLPSQRGTTDTPTTAGPRIKLQKRMSSGPKLRRLNVKGRIPERDPGNAYDSEDSERELDPATEQQLVLRMQPGEDCDLLRKAIAERTIGLTAQEGGVDVAIKFLDRELRRSLITIKKNMYAAVLVDLPCVIETMKSWDKRGWWKVADISQMLLVLGQVTTEEEARHMALPARVVNERTMAYAHGLTPPMHWVRKRRFRKRLSYKDTANVEEEVTRLLEEDARIEAGGGQVNFEIRNRDSIERSPEPDDYFQQGADDAVDTIENYYDDAEGEEVDEMDLDDMQAMFDDQNVTSTAYVDSPATLQEHSAVVQQEMSGTPAETPAPADNAEDELFGGDADDSSDEDDSDDDIDTFDEDAQARAAEQNMQNQEIEDLENEIRLQRQKLDATKNQILRNRQAEKLKSLQEDLRMKKRVFGLVDDEEED